jgi:two-component system, OmpR family, sensor histidine kinase BaeS
MRLKLVHQLSLLLGTAALLAVLAVSAVVWWNLQAGFSDYVKARDSAQLDRLAQIIAARSDRISRF